MKLTSILALSVLALALTGCGALNRSIGSLTGYTLVCVKETGVIYLQFPTGAAVLLDKDGKPKACN